MKTRLILFFVTAMCIVLTPVLSPAASWSIVESAVSGYYEIWGASADDIFAVGENGAIRHFNGSVWSSMSAPTSEILTSVWGDSGQDVFAVGQSGTILHYNGASWSAMPSPTTYSLNAVWGLGPDNVFAVGDAGTALHYDGASWSLMSTGVTENFNGLWAYSTTNVFAVGNSGVIMHYNGSTWNAMASGTSMALYGVRGRTELLWPDPLQVEVFAVGENGTALRYDGSNWTIMNTGIGEHWLLDVWCAPDSKVYAVGNQGVIAVYDDGAWSEMQSPVNYWLHGVWASSDYNVYAVGHNGNILRYEANDLTGWWYNAAESGTGLSLEVQGDHIFLCWYVYDASGAPVWFVSTLTRAEAPAADDDTPPDDDDDSGFMTRTQTRSQSQYYEGDLLTYTGWTLGQPWEATGDPDLTGTVSLTFSDSQTGVLDWSYEVSPFYSRSRTWSITKYMPDLAAGDQDPRGVTGWWWDPTYPGMGFFMEAQGDTIYIGWFHYGDSGDARWWGLGGWLDVGGFPSGSGTYTAACQQYAGGQTMDGVYQAPGSPAMLDTATFTFAGSGSGMSITVSWQGETYTLERFKF